MKTLITAALGSLVAAGSALAQDPMSAEPKFSAVDANADGVVSEQEFVVYMTATGQSEDVARQQFAAAAGDDGQMTEAEFGAAIAAAARR